MFHLRCTNFLDALQNAVADCARVSQRIKKAPLNPLATLDPGVVNLGAVEPAALK